MESVLEEETCVVDEQQTNRKKSNGFASEEGENEGSKQVKGKHEGCCEDEEDVVKRRGSAKSSE